MLVTDIVWSRYCSQRKWYKGRKRKNWKAIGVAKTERWKRTQEKTPNGEKEQAWPCKASDWQWPVTAQKLRLILPSLNIHEQDIWEDNARYACPSSSSVKYHSAEHTLLSLLPHPPQQRIWWCSLSNPIQTLICVLRTHLPHFLHPNTKLFIYNTHPIWQNFLEYIYIYTWFHSLYYPRIILFLCSCFLFPIYCLSRTREFHGIGFQRLFIIIIHCHAKHAGTVMNTIIMFGSRGRAGWTIATIVAVAGVGVVITIIMWWCPLLRKPVTFEHSNHFRHFRAVGCQILSTE